MISVVGEEYIAYRVSSSGSVSSYIPLVAVVRYDNDGKLEFRDLKKQDIVRIPPISTSLTGGWLFRLAQNVSDPNVGLSYSSGSGSWIKRFVVTQGEMVSGIVVFKTSSSLNY